MAEQNTPKPDNVEPDRSFDQAWVKLRWADQHVRRLQAIFQAFITQHPQTVAVENNLETGEWRLVILPTQPLPLDFPCLTGDAIHNMRAALDYCWMGLHRSIDPEARKVTLPRGINRQEVVGTLTKAAIEQSIPGVNDFVLDRVKPYRGGNDLLWRVGQLDNWDKHNFLPIALAITLIRRMTIRSRSRRVDDIQFTDIQVKAGKPWNFLSVTAGPNDPIEFDGEPNFAVDVVLRVGEPVDEWPLVQTLFAMLKESADAVKLFKATFGRDAGH